VVLRCGYTHTHTEMCRHIHTHQHMMSTQIHQHMRARTHMHRHADQLTRASYQRVMVQIIHCTQTNTHAMLMINTRRHARDFARHLTKRPARPVFTQTQKLFKYKCCKFIFAQPLNLLQGLLHTDFRKCPIQLKHFYMIMPKLRKCLCLPSFLSF